jgi:hypothetical protein
MIEKKIRILYVYLGGNLTDLVPGVQTKIIKKIEALNTKHSNCNGVSFSFSSETDLKLSEKLTILSVQTSKKRKYFLRCQNLIDTYSRLTKYINENENFDFILFRYPLSNYWLYKFSKEYGNKLIFEHNTLEIKELKLELISNLKKISFKSKPSYYLSFTVNNLLPFLGEWFFSKRIFKLTKMGVSVTKELALYNSRKIPSYKNIVVSNGIDCDAYLLTKKFTSNEIIKIFILCGYKAPWHGIDRIINSLNKYNGERKIKLSIIGNIDFEDSFFNSESKNISIEIMPNMLKHELDEYLKEFHFSLGTMALHIIKMNEASPLKVRESFARGFPVVIGYDDTDITEENPFVYRVANDNSFIDFSKIIEWYDFIHADQKHPQKIREFAKLHLDVNSKMEKIIQNISRNV